jgi:hypothetical protein
MVVDVGNGGWSLPISLGTLGGDVLESLMNGEDGQEQSYSRQCTNVHILSLKSSDKCALGEFLWGGDVDCHERA